MHVVRISYPLLHEISIWNSVDGVRHEITASHHVVASVLMHIMSCVLQNGMACSLFMVMVDGEMQHVD